MAKYHEPQAGEHWRLKSNPKKVLTIKWINSCGYVHFEAPWMKVRQGCALDTLHKYYERV
jgi:hypothetical protein